MAKDFSGQMEYVGDDFDGTCCIKFTPWSYYPQWIFPLLPTAYVTEAIMGCSLLYRLV